MKEYPIGTRVGAFYKHGADIVARGTIVGYGLCSEFAPHYDDDKNVYCWLHMENRGDDNPGGWFPHMVIPLIRLRIRV